MYELKINGCQNFMGMKIPIVEGGFEENNRVITAYELSKIHNMELKEVNKSINRLISKDRLKEDIDYINIISKVNSLPLNVEDIFGVKSSYLSRTSCIFILSERGYSKLVKSMDDDISWNIMDKLIDEYFIMREIINSDEVLKSKALLMAMEGTSVEERIHGISKYAELITKPLKEKNKVLEDTIDNIVDTNISYESLRRELVANLKEISKILHNSKFQKTYSEFYKFLLDNGYNLELRRTNRKKKIINEIDDLDIDIAKVQDEINRVTVEMLVFNKSDGDYKELSNLKKKYLKELSEHKKIQRRLLSEFNKLEKGSKLDLIKEDEYKDIIVITRAWSLSNGYTNWKEKLDVKNDNTPLPF